VVIRSNPSVIEAETLQICPTGIFAKLETLESEFKAKFEAEKDR